jgi:hypothetical protein
MGRRPKNDSYTKEYLLAKLKEASEIFGTEVSAEEINSLPGFPVKYTYQCYFGGFNKAKAILGLFPNTNGKGDLKFQPKGARHKERQRKSITKLDPEKARKLPLKERFEIFTRDGFKCIYCGRGVNDGTKLVIDHAIPFSKGGPTTKNNMVTACWECNSGKRDVIIGL